MKACGVIVEYNPFHNGHLYHLEQSKKVSNSQCMIAVMSGNFLQRGEPAIISKWRRAEAALHSGADLVLELPYIYAVQHSDYFSQGAVQTLSEIGVNTICFGSENGTIHPFIDAYHLLHEQAGTYQETVQKYLNKGLSYPEASRLGYESIHLPSKGVDLSKPNNILGYSYVKQILAYNPEIKPLTIQRKNNNFHDLEIKGHIASATSIRKQLLKEQRITPKVKNSVPSITETQLRNYREHAGRWHEWGQYFHLLQYKILTMKERELRAIHGMDEGLEHRLKRSAKEATSFQELMTNLKTKRYTWTRLQRTLVHMLTGTTKEEAQALLSQPHPPYVRILGMSEQGKRYLNQQKKKMNVPLVTQPQRLNHPMIEAEEKAMISYYSVLEASIRKSFIQEEYKAPLRL